MGNDMTEAPEQIWIEDEFGEYDEDQWCYGTWDSRSIEGYDTQYIRVDIAKKPRVKPLVWDERRNGYWQAKGAAYQIASNGDGTWRVRLDGKVIYRRRPDMEAAKAAAQSDHKTRVLAFLEFGA